MENQNTVDFMSVTELARRLNVSKTTAYAYVKSEDCKLSAIHIGKNRILIPILAYENWYRKLCE